MKSGKFLKQEELFLINHCLIIFGISTTNHNLCP